MLALVLLFGMIFLGAAAVLVTGGYLLDSVQEDSKHQLAQDAAEQTHDRIFEAAASGDARTLPIGDGDAIETRVVDSGSITLTMANGSDPCGRSVSAELGAIEYDAGDREVVYEGGAIWEHSESGYSVRRAPGIDYTDGQSRISLTVIEGTDTDEDGETVVVPNRTRSRQLNDDLSAMILECRLADDGYRDLNVTVESQHAEIWERYFEESVAAGNADVAVHRVRDGVVRLTIDDISDPIDFEEWLVIHEWERETDAARIENGTRGLNVSVRVRNTGPAATNGTVTLNVTDGPDTSVDVTDLDRGELQWVDLQLPPDELSGNLTAGDVYEYHVNVTPQDPTVDQWTFEGENASVSHAFYFGEPSDVFQVQKLGHTTTDTTVEIQGLIANIGTEDGVQDAELRLYHEPTDQQVPVGDPTIETNLSANASGTVSWTLNRTTIAGGTYHYTISTEDDNRTGRFDVSSFKGGNGGVTTGTVGTGTITVLGTEVSAESLLSVEVPPGERADATVERTDRGMFMPTVVAEWRGGGQSGSWVPVERSSGWVPAERVDGDLVPTNESPNCAVEPTDYETDTSETYDDWYGWEPNDCWNHPDGFVWSDSGGYELEWAIAGQTTEGNHWRAPVVDRDDTTWTLGGDGELQYEKNWAPVSAEVIVEQDGEEERHHEWKPGNADEDENLNTHDTQEREWTQEISLQRGAKVTVASTLWGCSDYDDVGTRSGDMGYQWRDYDCDDVGGVANSVDASGKNTDPGVRVLTDGDEVPVLRAGYPDQRSADDVLNDGAADRIDATTGELDLGPNEAVFLIELTDRNPAWGQAKTQDSYGDPNYNDVIVLFEYEAIVQEVAVDAVSGPDENDGFDPGTPGGGDTDSGTGGDGSNIETDVTHVVIG